MSAEEIKGMPFSHLSYEKEGNFLSIVNKINAVVIWLIIQNMIFSIHVYLYLMFTIFFSVTKHYH